MSTAKEGKKEEGKGEEKRRSPAVADQQPAFLWLPSSRAQQKKKKEKGKEKEEDGGRAIGIAESRFGLSRRCRRRFG